MKRSNDDVAEYKQEWKYWLGGTVIFLAIYVFRAVASGDWGFSVILVPPMVWALILIVIPLLTKPTDG